MGRRPRALSGDGARVSEGRVGRLRSFCGNLYSISNARSGTLFRLLEGNGFGVMAGNSTNPHDRLSRVDAILLAPAIIIPTLTMGSSYFLFNIGVIESTSIFRRFIEIGVVSTEQVCVFMGLLVLDIIFTFYLGYRFGPAMRERALNEQRRKGASHPSTTPLFLTMITLSVFVAICLSSAYFLGTATPGRIDISFEKKQLFLTMVGICGVVYFLGYSVAYAPLERWNLRVQQ